jgi:hypothetical protein
MKTDSSKHNLTSSSAVALNVLMGTGKGTSNEVGLAGEFHVLAQLCQRGYSAHPTLGNTKGLDILVVDQESGLMLKV